MEKQEITSTVKNSLIRASLPHLCLLVILAVYNLAGAFLFLAVEGPYEAAHKDSLKDVEQRMADSLWSRLSTTGRPVDELQFRSLLAHELRHYETELRSAYSAGIKTDSNVRVWSFWGSLYYTSTIYTTIGYGNFTPATSVGRWLTVFYGLIGIPLFAIVLNDVGKLMTRALKKLLMYVTYDDDQFNFNPPVALFIVAVYIVVGACLFAMLEGWNITEAFYFVFITISTVGFGDFVPETPERYALCFFYLLGGLSLLAMVINVLSEYIKVKLDRSFDLYIKSPHEKTS